MSYCESLATSNTDCPVFVAVSTGHSGVCVACGVQCYFVFAAANTGQVVYTESPVFATANTKQHRTQNVKHKPLCFLFAAANTG